LSCEVRRGDISKDIGKLLSSNVIIQTDAANEPQAGRTLFGDHTFYCGRDQGFPDFAGRIWSSQSLRKARPFMLRLTVLKNFELGGFRSTRASAHDTAGTDGMELESAQVD
jgi:hypothetical protein